MKYYAMLLNLNEAHEFSLKEKDLFSPLVQGDVLERILCGGGRTEEEALQNTIENLVDEGVLEICKCGTGVQGIMAKVPCKQALRHLWLEHDEYHDELKLHAMAYHDSLVDFCERYKLNEDAKQELESFFKTVRHAVN